MRIIKQVSVNGMPQQLVEDQVRAELNTPGRAVEPKNWKCTG